MKQLRYTGQQLVSFTALPWLGEVAPGDVLSGAAADAVAGRPDFEDVDAVPGRVADSAIPADESPNAPADVPVEAAPVKSRRTAKSDIGA